MISDLGVFQMYGAMARHAAENQRVSAENIARADQPGYRAKQVESFEDFMARAAASGESMESAAFRIVDAGGAASPNGNTVSLEQEIFNTAEAAGQHDLALTVYSKSLDLLRTAIGKDR